MASQECARFARALRTPARMVAGGAGLAVAGYAVYAGATWLRYGHCANVSGEAGTDPLMDRIMPSFDVVERHQIAVDAPADVTLAAAMDQELTRLPLVRGLFKARELLMGSKPSDRRLPAGLIAMTVALGWRILEERPGREIVLGAVTQPWEPNVAFRGLPSQELANFWEPGYVKIIWSLRADPVDSARSIFRTETRASATDPAARRKFRLYWSFMSAGIRLIRRLSLRPVKAAAERRYATMVRPSTPVGWASSP